MNQIILSISYRFVFHLYHGGNLFSLGFWSYNMTLFALEIKSVMTKTKQNPNLRTSGRLGQKPQPSAGEGKLLVSKHPFCPQHWAAYFTLLDLNVWAALLRPCHHPPCTTEETEAQRSQLSHQSPSWQVAVLRFRSRCPAHSDNGVFL